MIINAIPTHLGLAVSALLNLCAHTAIVMRLYLSKKHDSML